ncbi:uncharacterized protein MELLADRAFT_116405 [Melampsora larici-populina 98AG31]|uniref:Proline iminopeptidase n=1 Tax=Melampsora larici-populina (strain 98AG31 / pathotype 3-4-7) TaxID=747676 RepID=F4RKT7_MELLP|nr:uncharacterized protein MELLADRAFT_116405 [Melampsora larici-populina 98AG31]EGG06783.1 hypothetical protein MELLADRAFT_116405 [Melampsora larici-populina 98AG31]
MTSPTLFDVVSPFAHEMLVVSKIHTLYVEQSGNPNGKPVIFIHGGPGGGCSEFDRRYFDPKIYRVVLFDQRGAGKSTPPSCLEENTTWDLVSDIEKIREHLKIEKWVVFGGSWGSTLSLAYAQSFPQRVKALILRGIFTLRKEELNFFYQGPGSNFLFPDAWEKYISVIPEDERNDMVSAYYKRLTSTDLNVRSKAAKEWSLWECSTSRLMVDEEYLKKAKEDDFSDKFARIECHYFVNGGWMRDGQLLEKDEIDKIRHIPTVIVQGRYDVVCPAKTAWDLHKAWPEADFKIIPDAGHSAKESGTQCELLHAANKFKEL